MSDTDTDDRDDTDVEEDVDDVVEEESTDSDNQPDLDDDEMADPSAIADAVAAAESDEDDDSDSTESDETESDQSDGDEEGSSTTSSTSTTSALTGSSSDRSYGELYVKGVVKLDEALIDEFGDQDSTPITEADVRDMDLDDAFDEWMVEKTGRPEDIPPGQWVLMGTLILVGGHALVETDLAGEVLDGI